METMIKVGQRIVANVTTQGMISGNTYTVTQVDITDTPFGRFVQYQLDGGIWVQNLPLLVKWVSD